MATAWYTFPRIDNLGGIEPFGGFPKPDSNIQLPANYPITALLSGVVTGIDRVSAWGTSVTIKLDNPLNSLATHTAYLHLAGLAPGIQIGSVVKQGQLIAYNGGAAATGTQKVPLGFALYNGDNYGSGSAWGLMTKANLQGALNPVPLLDKAAKGGSILGLGGTFSSTEVSNGTGNPIVDAIMSGINGMVNTQVLTAELGINKFLMIAGFMIVALITIYFGVVLLTGKDIGDGARAAASKALTLKKVGEVAAL